MGRPSAKRRSGGSGGMRSNSCMKRATPAAVCWVGCTRARPLMPPRVGGWTCAPLGGSARRGCPDKMPRRRSKCFLARASSRSSSHRHRGALGHRSRTSASSAHPGLARTRATRRHRAFGYWHCRGPCRTPRPRRRAHQRTRQYCRWGGARSRVVRYGASWTWTIGLVAVATDLF